MLRQVAQALGPALRWQVQPAAACSLLALRGVKTTTGIVGLPADPQARQHLEEKCRAVLEALEANGIPNSAEYRRAVEKSIIYRLELLATDAPDEDLEYTLGRQLEEEIRMCENELGLIPKMAEWKPWEVPEGHTVEVIEEQDVETKVAGGAK